ncbi:secretion system protein [Archaeoglobales archaeon]|nr:MAG: secretion system protein [Archaeoglobales archaeon]
MAIMAIMAINMNLYLFPMKKDELRRILRGALMDTAPETHAFHSLLAGIGGGVSGYIIYALKILKPSYGEIFFPLAFFLFFYLLFAFSPLIKMKSRQSKIDMKLPHAITYMQSLSSSMPLFEVFRSVFQEKDLYEEVSEEFGFVVRDVELFGEDIVTAMRNLACSTPSQNLRELLDGLIIVFESGGDLRNYFSSKSSHFRERAIKQLEVNLKTLEILAEVFVVVFVAMPIFLIIMISSMELVGKTAGYEFFLYLYFFIPIGSMALIYILDQINIKEDLGITRVERKRRSYPTSIISRKSVSLDPKKLEKRKLIEIAYKPFKSVKTNYYNAIYFSLIALLVFVLVYQANVIPLKFHESIIPLSTIAFCIPLLVAFEYRARYVRRVEKEIPELLRQFLNLEEVGLTMQSIISIIKESKIGVLSRELKIIDADLGWGATILDALVEFINRVGISSIRRAISLIIRASEMTEDLRDILLISIEDFEHGLKMKGDRFASGFAYLVIVYVSFFTFMYTVYSMNSSFLVSLKKLNVPLNFAESLTLMYRTSLFLALFSGIIAGQMEKGNILHGLKHICIFMLASFFLFEYILGGAI